MYGGRSFLLLRLVALSMLLSHVLLHDGTEVRARKNLTAALPINPTKNRSSKMEIFLTPIDDGASKLQQPPQVFQISCREHGHFGDFFL